MSALLCESAVSFASSPEADGFTQKLRNDLRQIEALTGLRYAVLVARGDGPFKIAAACSSNCNAMTMTGALQQQDPLARVRAVFIPDVAPPIRH